MRSYLASDKADRSTSEGFFGPATLDALALLGLALAVRLVWALLSPDLDPFLQLSPLHGDGGSYDLLAQNLLAGEGYTQRPPQPNVFWPPLYPLFLSLLYALSGSQLAAVRIVHAALGAAVVVFFYLIARRHAGRRVAWLVGLGLAFYPHLIYFGNWIIAEAPYLFLLGLALWLLARWQANLTISRLAVLGLLFGLCALAKPVTLSMMPFIALWLFLAPEGKAPAGRLRPVVVLAAFTLVTILPWTLRNYLAYQEFVLISTNGGYTFLGANHAEAWGGHDEGFPPRPLGLNEAQAEEAYYAEGLAWIRSAPGDFARLLVAKYGRLLSPLSIASQRQDYALPGSPLVYGLYWLFLLASAVGLFLSARQWRRLGFMYAPIAGVIISAGLFYGDARYTLPIAPALVFFAALSVDRLLAALGR